MTKVTVTIDTKNNARLFLELLRSLNFVKDVQTEQLYEDELSKDDIKLLEDRWSDYIKHPNKVKTWNQVKQNLTQKYGR